MSNAELRLSWQHLSELVDIDPLETYPAGSLGELIQNLNTDNLNVVQVLQAHFEADNPHGIWKKRVLVDLDDILVEPSHDETVIKRMGSSNAIITLGEGFTKGKIVCIDNVFSNSGVVTVTTLVGTIYIDHNVADTAHTLTGKGQFNLIFDGANWVLFDIKN